MHVSVIQVCFLLLSSWLTAAEFQVGDLAFYSHLKEILDGSVLTNSTEREDDDKIFLSRSLKQLSLNIKVNLDNVRSLVGQYDYKTEISNELLFVKALIDSIWSKFSVIVERPSEVSTTAINDMAAALDIIHSNLTTYQPMLNNNLLAWIGRLSEPSNMRSLLHPNFTIQSHPYVFCEKKTSDQLTMHNIIKNLMELEMAVFVATILHHRQYNHSLDSSLLEDNHSQLSKRLESYEQISSAVMANRSNIIYSCDIDNYIRDVNYIELEGLIQPIFITNRLGSCEAANYESNVPSCIELLTKVGPPKGSNVSTIQFNCDGESVDLFVSNRNEKPCYGHLADCAPLKSREVCRNNMYAQPDILRRYSWYKINDTLFGQADACANGLKEEFINYEDERIQHCYCTCYDNGPESPTTHLLSMKWSSSDIEENKVVTGIKFTRVDKIVHLQIKQGILSSEGRILPDSENWKPVSNIDILGLDNERDDTFRDFTFVVLDENTIFDLDDVIPKFEWTVTGVKFHLLDSGRIKLMVRQTKYDWGTGLLDKDIENREINPNPNPHELLVSLINPALHQPQVPNVPDSTSNFHYVKFRESSRKADGGSTILPFFDAQKVEMLPSSPVRGIKLYHRGSSQSAGSISLGLIGFNYNYGETLRSANIIRTDE